MDGGYPQTWWENIHGWVREDVSKSSARSEEVPEVAVMHDEDLQVVSSSGHLRQAKTGLRKRPGRE